MKGSRVYISQELSTKLGIISFLSILFVLFNHARLDAQNGFNFELQFPNLNTVNTVVVGMTRLNRVLFFGIAGFLFGNGAPFNISSLTKKLQTRLWTVLVPYLFAIAIIASGILIAINILGPEFSRRSPTLSPIVASLDNWGSCLLQIRIRAGIHLWFIESLILNVVVFGFYSLLTGWGLIAHMVLLVFTAFGFVSTGNIFLEGAFYFSLGTFMSRWYSILQYTDRRMWTLLLKVFVWIPLLALYIRESRSDPGLTFGILRILQSVLGAAIVWQAVDFFPTRLHSSILPLAAYTFPVYLIHAPFTLGAIRHAYIRIMPASELSYSIAWFVIAVTTYLVSYSIAKLLERMAPKVAALIFGGRGAARSKSA